MTYIVPVKNGGVIDTLELVSWIRASVYCECMCSIWTLWKLHTQTQGEEGDEKFLAQSTSQNLSKLSNRIMGKGFLIGQRTLQSHFMHVIVAKKKCEKYISKSKNILIIFYFYLNKVQ